MEVVYQYTNCPLHVDSKLLEPLHIPEIWVLLSLDWNGRREYARACSVKHKPGQLTQQQPVALTMLTTAWLCQTASYICMVSGVTQVQLRAQSNSGKERGRVEQKFD